VAVDDASGPEHLGVQTSSGGRVHDDRVSGRGGTPAKETPRSVTAPSVEHIALNSQLTLRSGFGPSETVQIWDSSDPHSATTMTRIT
jgi:hypothetical protein